MALERPTHITIVGKSKHVFNIDVQPRLIGRFEDLIQRLAPGPSIVLSKSATEANIEPLLNFLMRSGIPRSDMRLRYPNESQSEMGLKLKRGLSESGLGFGADVAERDNGLVRYFITTRSFEAVRNHGKHIVIGPKGSGKSAILRGLTAERRESLVITPEHYATEVLDAVMRTPSSTELAAYTTTWKYTLLVEIFRRLVQEQLGDVKALAEIRKYLVQHRQLGMEISLFERFLNYLRRIKQLKGKLGPAEAEINIDELGKLFKMDELLELIPALQKVLRRTPFTVYIDELDQSWNNSDTANHFLVSLLAAAIQLRGLSENLHVVVFLRSEVFELLKPHLPQLDKLRSDIESLQWSRRELTSLIMSRALDALDVHREDLTAEAVIRLLFPGSVEPSKTPTFEYLLSRTSFRPREVIQFCNLALEAAIQLDFAYIQPEAVLRADEEFSTWKLEHVVAENMYIYPRLDYLLEMFRHKPKRWSLSLLDSIFADAILQAEDDPNAPAWLRARIEPLQLLRILYELEVLGIEKNLRESPDELHIWDSYEFVFSRPKAKPETSQSFLVHPGLWKALELV